MIEGVRSRLLESIRLRLRADVPVGVHLSGSIDSSVIAGMVTHLIRERGAQIGNEKETDRISCFSIAFDEDSGLDESGENITSEQVCTY
jgi:asparagine synthase (glutamine-hydrolysing)